jgi:hypothetical protein
MKDHPALSALLLVSALIVLLCLAFDPKWQTNDDVVMSMAAHGYGIAAYGSPHIVFSNVLWGYLVRAIPTINGVLGYSIATMSTLLVIGWAMFYFLLRLGAGYATGFLAVTLIIVRPTLYPQFTINAGLLTATAFIGWQVYARSGGISNLVVACLLAFFGYLIRSEEFLLVLMVALPILPWQAMRERRQMQIAFLLLSMAIASSSAFDRWSYSGPEWAAFLEFNSVRVPYTDFGADKLLKQHPEILARYGYSQNDIDLVRNWFFADPQIADPKSLNAMLAELGFLPLRDGAIWSGFLAIRALGELLVLVLPALILFVLAPNRWIAFAWIFCLTALFAIGVMGRPGILRIYIPLVSLLLVAPLIHGKCIIGVRRWLTALTLFAASSGSIFLVMPHALLSKEKIQQAQKDMHRLHTRHIVTWGEGFPYESAFPVFANDPSSRSIVFYGIDSLTYAPFSVATAWQLAGSGLLERLKETTGIQLVGSPEKTEMLRIYCRERLNGQLNEVTTYQGSRITIQQVRCMAE